MGLKEKDAYIIHSLGQTNLGVGLLPEKGRTNICC